MSEPEDKPQTLPEQGKQPSSTTSNGEAFRRAENLLTVDNEDSGEQAHEALAAMEGREASDRQSDPTTDSVALTERLKDEERAGDAVDAGDAEEVKDALEDEALEAGVSDANDASRIVWDLTPHNL